MKYDYIDEDSIDYFETLIKKLNLYPDYIVYQNKYDEIIIDEQWKSPKNDSVIASKLFKFEINFIDLIIEDKRQEVLQKILDICVSIEDYEHATLVRNYIKNLNDNS
jgi:protein-arginine kinase activator protein McsA